MRGKIIEVTTSGNIRLYAPRKIITIVIQIARRLGKTNLYIDNITDSPIFYQFLYFLKIRKITPIICDEAGDTRFFGYAVDAGTFFISDGHRLLYIGRLACFHGHDCISGV